MILSPWTLKVKKERAAAEKRRKKERRRQRKKEKRKIKKKELSSDKRHWGGWNIIDWIRSDHQKKREYKPQMLEKFSLIEELEQHIASGGLGCSLYNSNDINRGKLCACHKPFDGVHHFVSLFESGYNFWLFFFSF